MPTLHETIIRPIVTEKADVRRVVVRLQRLPGRVVRRIVEVRVTEVYEDGTLIEGKSSFALSINSGG